MTVIFTVLNDAEQLPLADGTRIFPGILCRLLRFPNLGFRGFRPARGRFSARRTRIFTLILVRLRHARLQRHVVETARGLRVLQLGGRRQRLGGGERFRRALGGRRTHGLFGFPPVSRRCPVLGVDGVGSPYPRFRGLNAAGDVLGRLGRAALGGLTRGFVLEVLTGDGARELAHYFVAVLKNWGTQTRVQSLWGVKDKSVNPTQAIIYFAMRRAGTENGGQLLLPLVKLLSNNGGDFRGISHQKSVSKDNSGVVSDVTGVQTRKCEAINFVLALNRRAG